MKSNRLFAVFMVLMLLLGMVPSKQTVHAVPPTELFFSEYIEGSSNN